MMCATCGFDKNKGVIVASNSLVKRIFVCTECFVNPSLWYGFVKWRQQQGLSNIHILVKNLNRSLDALNDPHQTKLFSVVEALQ